MDVTLSEEATLDLASLSHVGTERENNEDACGLFVEAGDSCVVAVADGVSSYPGGEVASQLAVDAVIRAFREEPASAAAGQRLYRAVQQANIDVHDRAITVPELRGMATTLTAVALERGELTAVHVGDSRLYLVRDGAATQLTKDHTVAAEKVRFGILSKERARHHGDRAVLTRCLGRELIVSRDRLTRRVSQGDVLLLCTDGLHTVLDDAEIAALVSGRDAAGACRALVDAANAKGTPDNLGAAVIRLSGAVPEVAGPDGIAARMRRFLTGTSTRSSPRTS